jgi:hypothetical protein
MEEPTYSYKRGRGHALYVWVEKWEIHFPDDSGEPSIELREPADGAVAGGDEARVQSVGSETFAVGYRDWVVLLRPRREWLLLRAAVDKSGNTSLKSTRGVVEGDG